MIDLRGGFDSYTIAKLFDKVHSNLKKQVLSKSKFYVAKTKVKHQYLQIGKKQTVLNAGSKLSMDGKGRCLDNVWIERFWRTVKYDFLFLYEFKGSLNLYKGIRWFICYYNDERCHSSLGHKTPNEVYETSNLTFKKIA